MEGGKLHHWRNSVIISEVWGLHFITKEMLYLLPLVKGCDIENTVDSRYLEIEGTH